MAKDKVEKTNAMRLLDAKKAVYKEHILPIVEAVSGEEAARLLGVDAKYVYKTLVTVGKSLEHYVFVVPVACELDLKKAAQVVGEKNIEMVHSKDLLPLTGYVHGGCSPVGMKKRFPTFIDVSAQELEEMTVSAGKVGHQVTLAPQALAGFVGARFAPIAK